MRSEYIRVFNDQAIKLIDCDARLNILSRIEQENKAFGAYGTALSGLAQDQFVTTTQDGSKVQATLKSLGTASPIVTAVGTVFSSIEKWALAGYRQKKVSAALSGDTAVAFETISSDMHALANDYTTILNTEVSDLRIIRAKINKEDARKKEPVATAEMSARLDQLISAQKTKYEALSAYDAAIGKLPEAFNDASLSVKSPKNKVILSSIKEFASDALGAHDAIAAAIK